MAEKKFVSGKMLALGLVAIIVATVGTSLLTSYLLRGGEKSTAAVTKPEKLATMSVGEFTVNLADQSSLHFLRTSISLAIDEGKQQALQGQEAQIRDQIIQVLRSKNRAALQEPQALQALRKELLGKLNRTVGQGKIFAIYFTDFVVQ